MAENPTRGDFELKKFMILHVAPVSAEVQMNVSPEEVKKGMEPWNAWYKKCGKAIVDFGAPLGKGDHVLIRKGVLKARRK